MASMYEDDGPSLVLLAWCPGSATPHLFDRRLGRMLLHFSSQGPDSKSRSELFASSDDVALGGTGNTAAQRIQFAQNDFHHWLNISAIRYAVRSYLMEIKPCKTDRNFF